MMGKVQFYNAVHTLKKGPGEVPAKLFGLYDVGHRYSKNMHEIHYVVFAFAGQDGGIYYWIVPDFPSCKPLNELFKLVGFTPTPDADFMDILQQKPVLDLILNEKGYVIGVKEAPPDVPDFEAPNAVELSLAELIDAIDNGDELPRFVQVMVEKSLEFNNTVPEKVTEEHGYAIGDEETLHNNPNDASYQQYVPSGTVAQEQSPESEEENEPSNPEEDNTEAVAVEDESNEEENNEEESPVDNKVIATEEVYAEDEDEGNSDEEGDDTLTIEEMRAFLQAHADDPIISSYLAKAGLQDKINIMPENTVRILYSFYMQSKNSEE
jgi:hypothetical protein